MKTLLLFALLMVSGCAAFKPLLPPPTPVLDEDPPKLVPAGPFGAPMVLDSAFQVRRNAPAEVPAPRSIAGKVWGAITGAGKVKDKSRNTTNVYYSPAKVKTTGGSTAAVGDGNTATTVTKPKAPVTTAPGATATDNTKAGQRGGAAATGAGATATATTTKSGLPWWAYAVGGVAVFAGGWYMGTRGFTKLAGLWPG